MIKAVNNKTRVLLLRPKSDIIEKAAHPRACRPPYILKYTQALLNQQPKLFDVKLIDCYTRHLSTGDVLHLIDDFQPHMLCINELNIDQLISEEIISTFDQGNRPVIVLCGQAVSANETRMPEEILQNIIILKGEAEEALASLAEDLHQHADFNTLKDKYEKPTKYMVKNPDQLPTPPYTLKDLSKYEFCYPIRHNQSLRWGHVLSARGCPYACNFCSPVMRESYGNTMRLRSAENIVDEIEYQKNLGVNIFSFDDDDFTANRHHTQTVCQELIKRKINLPFIVHARVDEVDRELLKLMKKAGCVLLRFGIESASEDILYKIHKGNPKKWINMAKTAFKIAHELNIGTVGLFFVGAPGEEERDVEASISLAKELNPDILQVSFFTPYPGSAIYEQVKERLNREDVNRLYHYSAPIMNFSKIATDELITLQKRFYREFIFRPAFLFNHMKNFFMFYAHNLRITKSLLSATLKTH